jgi:hypothetical protein
VRLLNPNIKFENGTKKAYTVRLGVQCAADTAFEYGHPQWNEEENKMEYEFSGVGSVHQCRDWNTVKMFLENHRGNDQKDII